MQAHIHPYRPWFTCKPRPLMTDFVPALCPRPVRARQVPRVPLPAAGVTSCSVTSSITSESITTPSSLIRTHASNQIPPADFGLPYTASLRRLSPVPAGRWSFPTLFLRSLYRCLGPYPATTERCFRLFLPSSASASPSTRENRLVKTAPLNSFMWDMILGAATIR